MTSSEGVTESYDKLVIATGSNPLIIPVPGHDFAGVLTYRDLDDVNAMLLAAQSRAKAVVIGGGLLGLEAAAGLQSQGMDVTVVHLMPTLMERQLDPAAGYLLQKALEERGIRFSPRPTPRRSWAMAKSRASNSPTEGSFRRRWSSWRRVSGRTQRWARTRVSPQTAESWSTTPCGLPIRTSTRWANAPR